MSAEELATGLAANVGRIEARRTIMQARAQEIASSPEADASDLELAAGATEEEVASGKIQRWFTEQRHELRRGD